MPQRGLVSEVKIEGCLERDARPSPRVELGYKNPGARNFHYFYSRIFLPLSLSLSFRIGALGTKTFIPPLVPIPRLNAGVTKRRFKIDTKCMNIHLVEI